MCVCLCVDECLQKRALITLSQGLIYDVEKLESATPKFVIISIQKVRGQWIVLRQLTFNIAEFLETLREHISGVRLNNIKNDQEYRTSIKGTYLSKGCNAIFKALV